MLGTLNNISVDYNDNKVVLSLKLDSKAEVDELIKLKEDKLDITIKKARNKRSLNANSYLWVMCNKLAQKLNISELEVYREHIKDLAVCKQFTLDENEANTFKTAWQMLGLGWICEQIDITSDNKIILNAYYGSSTYNTKQMSRLINNVVEDCKEQGIETLTPNEINKMIGEWNK